MRVYLGKYKLEYFKVMLCAFCISATCGSDETMLMVIVFIILCVFFSTITFNMKGWLRNEVIFMSRGYVEVYFFLVKAFRVELSRRLHLK